MKEKILYAIWANMDILKHGLELKDNLIDPTVLNTGEMGDIKFYGIGPNYFS